MLNQRGILRVPDFALPKTSTRTSRTVDYRFVDYRVIDGIREEVPSFYKKLTICLTALILGTGVGVITPLVTQALERWQYF